MATQYKCPNFEVFLFVFYNIWPEYADLLCKSLRWVWIWENTSHVVIRLNSVLDLDLSHVTNIQSRASLLCFYRFRTRLYDAGVSTWWWFIKFLDQVKKISFRHQRKIYSWGSFLSSDNLVSFAHQICCGMEHLANHNVSSYGRQINFRLGLEL